jgi:hypothetical protein
MGISYIQEKRSQASLKHKRRGVRHDPYTKEEGSGMTLTQKKRGQA